MTDAVTIRHILNAIESLTRAQKTTGYDSLANALQDAKYQAKGALGIAAGDLDIPMESKEPEPAPAYAQPGTALLNGVVDHSGNTRRTETDDLPF
jgi:hypothetical protein